MRIFISTGEPSGDLHAASLIRAIRRRLPDAEFDGYGGPRMARAGARVLYPLVNLAVMWFLRVLLNLHVFIGLLRRADRHFREHRPDAVVLIDYPGFNWCIARRAKALGIPVIYFVPPQLWAWAGWRVKKMRKYVDHVLCSLPFEASWYHARGVAGATYVGHPYFDELAHRSVDEAFLAEQRGRPGRVVAVLPGSRTQEVLRNFPIMLRAALRVSKRVPEARFVVACLNETHQDLCRQLIEAEPGAGELPLELHEGRTAELIKLADLAWAVSGSVGLELMAEAVPTVVLYKVRRFDLMIARPFIKVRYISLVNLLADAEVMPEYLTTRDVSPDLADWALTWLGDESARRHASSTLATLRDRVARPGATERAAEAIASILEPSRPALKGPHISPVPSTNGRVDRVG